MSQLCGGGGSTHVVCAGVCVSCHHHRCRTVCGGTHSASIPFAIDGQVLYGTEYSTSTRVRTFSQILLLFLDFRLTIFYRSTCLPAIVVVAGGCCRDGHTRGRVTTHLVQWQPLLLLPLLLLPLPLPRSVAATLLKAATATSSTFWMPLMTTTETAHRRQSRQQRLRLLRMLRLLRCMEAMNAFPMRQGSTG